VLKESEQRHIEETRRLNDLLAKTEASKQQDVKDYNQAIEDMKQISESQRKVSEAEIAGLTEQNEKTSAQIRELTKRETTLLEKVAKLQHENEVQAQRLDLDNKRIAQLEEELKQHENVADVVMQFYEKKAARRGKS